MTERRIQTLTLYCSSVYRALAISYQERMMSLLLAAIPGGIFHDILKVALFLAFFLAGSPSDSIATAVTNTDTLQVGMKTQEESER